MSINPLYLFGGLFGAGILGGGALLLGSPDGARQILLPGPDPELVAKAAVQAPSPAAPPQDDRFGI